MKNTALNFLLLTFLLSMGLTSDRDVNPPAFAKPFLTGRSEKKSLTASSAESPDNAKKNNAPAYAPGHDKKRVVNKANHPVLVKNISVSAEEIPNDGSGYAEIRCSVFTPNDHARIESVTLMLSQGIHNPGPIHLIPDTKNILSPSAEGEYIGKIHIPWLMDSGVHSFQITAADSLGLTGQKSSEFKIFYRPKADLPRVGSLEFQEILETISGQSFVPHNRVEVLDSGEKAFHRRLALIQKAQHQINLQTYVFDAEGLCKQISEAMLKKANQGIEVNIILNTDSQIPISPINTLRLKLQGILYDWTMKAEASTQDKPDSGQSILSSILTQNPPARLSLVMFSADNIREKIQLEGKKQKSIAHWLKRIRRERGADDDNDTSPKHLDWLSQFQGPGGLPALPLLDYGSHEKILVVDGKTAILGGRNLEDKYFTHWIDLELLLEGPVVEQIQQGYLRSYEAFSRDEESRLFPRQQIFNGTSQKAGVSALFVQSFPWEQEYRTLLCLVAAIQACQKNFYASSQYLVLPHSLLRDALSDAATRGVDIRILMNSLQTSREATFSSSYFASINYIEPLLTAGIKVYEINGLDEETKPQPYYHVKEFLFDGNLAAVGSFNFSLRSCYVESENLVFIHNKDFCSQREDAFLKRIHTQASELTPNQLNEIRAQHRRKIELAKHIDLLF